MKTIQHPTHDQLLKFAHGRLAEPDFAIVEDHLATCDSCCQWISHQPDNTLLNLAREVATLGPERRTAHTVSPLEIPPALLDHPRYQVIGPIGSGGMGSVFKAEHRKMQRMVALKVVHPSLLSNAQAVERFEREVRVAARLSHPNIVLSHDADQAEGLHFLVMEFVDGESLDQRIARTGRASVADACEWVRQAALGLQHAHEQGMVHRDIKPQNLMLTRDGVVKILDFGLSRVVHEGLRSQASTGSSGTPHRTSAHMILGTPDYIAPEQISDSSHADERADIYSLGCTFYYLLAGVPPFDPGSVASKLHAHEAKPLPRLSEIRKDVPPKLMEIIDRMTAKSPANRYQSPGEVATALSAFAAQGSNYITPAREATSVAARLAKGHQPALNRRIVLAASIAGVASVGGIFALAAFNNLGRDPIVPVAPDKASARLLVMLPSKDLWYPDYESLVSAAEATQTKLVFTNASDKPSQVTIQSKPGYAIADVPLTPSLAANDYDGIVFIGYSTVEFQPGQPSGEITSRLIHDFQRQRKVVASLCGGQRALVQHDVIQGKRVSKCQSVSDDAVKWAGATRTTNCVEVDGRLVTASEAKYAPELLAAIQKIVSP